MNISMYTLLWLSSLFLQANDDDNWAWYTIRFSFFFFLSFFFLQPACNFKQLYQEQQFTRKEVKIEKKIKDKNEYETMSSIFFHLLACSLKWLLSTSYKWWLWILFRTICDIVPSLINVNYKTVNILFCQDNIILKMLRIINSWQRTSMNQKFYN